MKHYIFSLHQHMSWNWKLEKVLRITLPTQIRCSKQTGNGTRFIYFLIIKTFNVRFHFENKKNNNWATPGTWQSPFLLCPRGSMLSTTLPLLQGGDQVAGFCLLRLLHLLCVVGLFFSFLCSCFGGNCRTGHFHRCLYWSTGLLLCCTCQNVGAAL